MFFLPYLPGNSCRSFFRYSKKEKPKRHTTQIKLKENRTTTFSETPKWLKNWEELKAVLFLRKYRNKNWPYPPQPSNGCRCWLNWTSVPILRSCSPHTGKKNLYVCAEVESILEQHARGKPVPAIKSPICLLIKFRAGQGSIERRTGCGNHVTADGEVLGSLNLLHWPEKNTFLQTIQDSSRNQMGRSLLGNAVVRFLRNISTSRSLTNLLRKNSSLLVI